MGGPNGILKINQESEAGRKGSGDQGHNLNEAEHQLN